jgi:hypothetical protein
MAHASLVALSPARQHLPAAAAAGGCLPCSDQTQLLLLLLLLLLLQPLQKQLQLLLPCQLHL